MANDELITRIGEISIQVFTIGKLYGLKDLEKLSMQMNELADDIGSNWHTGTPTEDGMYLVQYGNGFHEILLVKDWKFMAVEYIDTSLGKKRHHYDVSDTVVAWQKITPFEEGEGSC